MCLFLLYQVSSTNETFQDLSLPIPGKDQLQFIRASSAQGPIDADGPLLQSSAGQRGSCADSASKLRWMSSVVKWPFNVACWMFRFALKFNYNLSTSSTYYGIKCPQFQQTVRDRPYTYCSLLPHSFCSGVCNNIYFLFFVNDC